MTRRESSIHPELRLVLDRRHIQVSAMSSLLRVLQAAVRETARADATARRLLDVPVAPSLYVSVSDVEGDDLTMSFAFESSDGMAADPSVVSRAFDGFMVDLGDRLKGLPQPGLWGRAVAGARRSEDASAVSKRMSQVHAELRRFPRSTLSFGGRTIRIEGDQIELSLD